MVVINSIYDLRNWADQATNDWIHRDEYFLDMVANHVRESEHPPYGSDWSDYLQSLNLEEIEIENSNRQFGLF